MVTAVANSSNFSFLRILDAGLHAMCYRMMQSDEIRVPEQFQHYTTSGLGNALEFVVDLSTYHHLCRDLYLTY